MGKKSIYNFQEPGDISFSLQYSVKVQFFMCENEQTRTTPQILFDRDRQCGYGYFSSIMFKIHTCEI